MDFDMHPLVNRPHGLLLLQLQREHSQASWKDSTIGGGVSHVETAERIILFKTKASGKNASEIGVANAID